MKSLTCATILVIALVPGYALGQATMGPSMSDDELIKLSLSAAPHLHRQGRNRHRDGS